MNNKRGHAQLTSVGFLYAQIDFGLLMKMGATRVPTHITAYLLYCHLNSTRKPWFFADPNSRPAFKVTNRTLHRWLNRLHKHGVITIAPQKNGRWPELRFNPTEGIPCGCRIGPGGVIERRA